MKKEYVIFLILVIVAAIVSGSSIAIATNYTYLAQSAKNIEVAQSSNTNPEANTAAPASDQTKKTSGENQEPQKIASTQPDSVSEPKANEMAITPEEKQQVEDMLTTLSKSQSNDYAQLITDFQSKHALTPTGCLDTQTLNAIIHETTLSKVSGEVKT